MGVASKKPLPWLEMMLESGAMLRGWTEEEKRATLEQVRNADKEGRRNLEQSLLLLLDVVPGVRKRVTEKAARDGFRKGIEKGIEEGIENNARDAILTVLRARNFEIRSEHLAKIERCKDNDMRQRWLARAVVAPSIDDVFT